MVEKSLQLISDTKPQSQESQWTPSRINTKKTVGVGLSDSHVQLFVASWTVAHQAPLSMEVSRQESWSRLPFPTPGDLPDPGIEPTSLVSPGSASGFFTIVPPRKPHIHAYIHTKKGMFGSECSG